jgi:hypothetical protein
MISFPVRHLPGAGALAPGFDIFVSDPLHHYMETGVLKGITERAERALQDAHEGLNRVWIAHRCRALATGDARGAADVGDRCHCLC